MSDRASDSRRKNVVLLGIGHTNAHIVKEWANNPIPGCDLICISNDPTATYSGMLPGTLGRQFSDDEMRIDLRALAGRSQAELVIADTSGIDLARGTLLFSDRDPIAFDALSIGVGSMPAGWQEHGESSLVVPIKPMQTFLERLNVRLFGSPNVAEVVETFDGRAGKSKLLTSSATREDCPKLLTSSATREDCPKLLTSSATKKIAIVGGGVASVEIAFCLDEQLRKRELRSAYSIDIFTSGDSVAEGMTDRSIRRLEKLLKSRSIHIAAGRRVTKVGEGGIGTEDGSHHPADAVIWSTGAAAPLVLGKLGLETDDRGFIATSRTLQSLSDPRIFAVGDSGTVVESPSPKAGVYAVRQCPILWNNLRAFFSGEELSQFSPQSDFLKLLNTGDGKALLEYGWITIHARWCWKLKTWIDQSFIRNFKKESS